jgi:hypothetical protein
MDKTPYQELMCLNGSKRFSKGRENVEDDERPGRQITMKNRTSGSRGRRLGIRTISGVKYG